MLIDDKTWNKLEELQDSNFRITGFQYSLIDYLDKRLKENIHPQNILNIRDNLLKCDKSSWAREIMKVMADHAINSKYIDHFAYMYRHETHNHEASIRTVFIDSFYFHAPSSLSHDINKVAKYIHVDPISLILKVLEMKYKYDSSTNKIFVPYRMIEEFNIPTQYDIIVTSCQKNSPIFKDLTHALVDVSLYDYIRENLQLNGDNDILAKAIRNFTFDGLVFDLSATFIELLASCGNCIPLTINYLMEKAQQEENWDYILTIGCKYNKRDLLKIIVESKDEYIIDKFLKLYGDDPQVKHLTPFI